MKRILLLPLVVLGVVVWLVYRQPPLQFGGRTTSNDAYAIELENRGRRAVVLKEVRLDGREQSEKVSLWMNAGRGELAGGGVLHLETATHLERLEIEGARIQPIQRDERNMLRFDYALLVSREDPKQGIEVTISYRYFGLPFTLTLSREQTQFR